MCYLEFTHPLLIFVFGNKVPSFEAYKARLEKLLNEPIDVTINKNGAFGAQLIGFSPNHAEAFIMIGNDVMEVEIDFVIPQKFEGLVSSEAPAPAVEQGVENTQEFIDLGEEADVSDLMKYKEDIKLYPSATTRQDVETTTQLKFSENNQGQRELLEFAKTAENMVLVGVQKTPNINADDQATEVLILVPVDKLGLPNIVDYAHKINGKVYGLTFEDGDVETASFFGNKDVNEFARTEGTHEGRLRILAEKLEMSEENVDAMLKEQFNALQAARQRIKNGENVVFEYSPGSDGYYPYNKLTFEELDQTADAATSFNPTNIAIEDGVPEGIVKIANTSVSVIFYPTVLNEIEIKWLLDNFGNWTKEVVESYKLLVDLKPRKDGVHLNNNQIYYTNKEGVAKPISKEQFERYLNTHPYRGRSTMLALNKEAIHMGAKKPMSSYIRNNFRPQHSFWKIGKRYVTDKANSYLSLTETTQLKAEVLDDYVTPLLDGLQAAPNEEAVDSDFLQSLHQGEGTVYGYYDPASDTIYYLEGNKEALAHERIHRNTVNWIKANPTSDEVTELTALLEEARKLPNPSKTVQYHLSSIEELIAGGLSNPETIEFLKGLDKDDWLTRIANVISRIISKFGVPLKSETYLKLLDIYDRIEANNNKDSAEKFLSGFFSVRFEDNEFPDFTIDSLYDRILMSRSMDALVVDFLNSGSKKVSIEHLQRTLVKKPDMFDALYTAFTEDLKRKNTPFAKFYIKNEANLRSTWLSNSMLFTIAVEEESEVEAVERKEAGDNVTKEGFDKRGNEVASLDLADYSIKSMISLLPAQTENKFGVKELLSLKDVYYELLDAFDGATSLEDMLEVLYAMPKYRILFDRLGVTMGQEGVVLPKDFNGSMLVSKFYQAFNKPALPFTVMVKESDGTYMLETTGVSTQNVKEKVASNRDFLMKRYRMTEEDWKKDAILNLKSGDMNSFVRLLGFTNNAFFTSPEFTLWKNRQTVSDWQLLLEEDNMTYYRLSGRKGKALRSLYEIYAAYSEVKKTRMARNANGDPVSSDTLPNTLTALATLYNSKTRDMRTGYMNHPVYKYTMTSQRLEQGYKIKLLSYGGIKGQGDTVRLSPSNWIAMNIETMLNYGYVEMLRTETSSSSWAYSMGGMWVYTKQDTVNQLKNYLRGELERVKQEREGFKVYNAKLSLFDYLPDQETLTDEEYIEFSTPYISDWLDNQVKKNKALIQKYNVSAELSSNLKETYPDYAELFTYNYTIHNIEESIIFNGGLEWYKDFHKRAKGKISTGATPISDSQWWDNLRPDEMLSSFFTNNKPGPIYKTFNVKEDVVTYKAGKVENGEYKPGSFEFETIFQGAVDSFMDRYARLRIPISRIDAIEKLLVKYSTYEKMEIGDGQGWINLDYYRLTQMATGNWPQEAEDLFQWEKIYFKKHFLGVDLTEAEQTVYKNRPNYQFVPAKYSYNGPEAQFNAPVFDKFSLMPLIPSVVHKTKWQPILIDMVKNQYAYMKHGSGTKVAQRTKDGYMGPVDIFNGPIPKESVYEIHASLLKEQLKTDPKIKKINTFGTQFRKLVFQDTKEHGVWLDLDTTGFTPASNLTRLEYFKALKAFQDSLTKEELYKRSPIAKKYDTYKSYINELIDIERAELYAELGYENGQIKDRTALISTLDRMSTSKTVAVKEFIALLKQNPELKIEAGSNKQTFEKMITGLVNERLLRSKVPGSQMIQVAPTGMTPIDWVKPTPEEYEKYGATGLRFYQVKDGAVLPAQIKLTLNGQYEFLYNDPEVKKKVKEGMTRLDAVNYLIKNDAEWLDAHREALTVTAYRIPTQGLSSMDVFEIAEFLPKSAGKIVILPLEIVAKSGSDYDIDKMSFFMPNLSKTGMFIDKEVEYIYTKERAKEVKAKLKENMAKMKEMAAGFEQSSKNKKEIAAMREIMDHFDYDLSTSQDIEEYNQANKRLRKLFKEQSAFWQTFNSILSERRKLMEEQETIHIAKLGRKGFVENMLLRTISDQILEPSNYHLLTTPLGTDIIKDTLRNLGTKNNQTPENPNPLADPKDSRVITLEANVGKRVGMLVNKQLLGIAAVANTFNQLYNKVNLKLTKKYFMEPQLLSVDERKEVADDGFIYIGSQVTLDGELKSEIYNQHVNATVDGAKEDYLGYANYTFRTFPVMMYLTLIGVPFERCANFINSKFLLELTANEAKGVSSTTYTNDKIKEFTRGYFTNGKLNVSYKELFEDLNVDLSKVDYNNMSDKENLAALVYFAILSEESRHFYELQLKTGRDTSSYQNVYNTMHLKDMELKINPDGLMRDTEVSGFNVSDEYLSIMQSIFDINYNPYVVESISRNAQEAKPKNRETFYRRASNELVEYLIKTRVFRDGMTLGEWGAKATEQVPIDLVNFIMDNPEVQRFKFIQDLQLTRDINLLFLKRDDSDAVYNDLYTSEMNELYELYPEFMEKLLLTAFLQTGFNRTYFSFADLIPPHILEDVLSLGIIEPPTAPEVDSFMSQFLMYNEDLKEYDSKRYAGYKSYTAMDFSIAETSEAVEETPQEEPVRTFVFNEEQTAAIEGAVEFIKNGNSDEFFVIEGKAGTGKTTIAEQIVKQFPNQTTYVAALSNKAKGVIRDKFKEAKVSAEFKSIAALLGMKLNMETGEFERNPKDKTVPPIDYADIILIDEASMVNEQMLELIFAFKPINAKVIFLGDIGQLPPIRTEKNAYYRDKKYLFSKKSPVFDSPNKAKLLTRVRQGEESPILPFADYFWENSQSSNPVNDPAATRETRLTPKGSLIFTNKFADIKNKVLDSFRKAVAEQNPNHIKVVTYRNETRVQLNEFVHNAIFGVNSPQFNKGELIIFNDSFGEIENSTETQIDSVSQVYTDELGISFVEITSMIDDELQIFPAVTKESELKYKAIVSNAFTEAFAIKGRPDYMEKLQAAWELKKRYASVDYGYAITSHKSQGSTYDIVVVDEKDIMSVGPISAKEKSESIYTALTRPRRAAIVISSVSVPNVDFDLNAELEPQETQEVVEEAPAPEQNTSLVTGENISSKGSEFARRLTNVGNEVGLTYKGKKYVNSEHAYQTWKSGSFNQKGYDLKGGKVRGGQIGDTFSIMTDIITEKLKQNPELITGIVERGGLEYIQKSTHTVIGDNFWESSGQNKFIEALYQAAKNVGIGSQITSNQVPASGQTATQGLVRSDKVLSENYENYFEEIENINSAIFDNLENADLMYQYYTVEELDIDTLDLSKKTAGYSDNASDYLKNELKSTKDQTTPILINGRSEVVEGWHRIHSLKANGVKTVKAYVPVKDTQVTFDENIPEPQGILRPDNTDLGILFSQTFQEKLESVKQNASYVKLTEDERFYVNTRTGKKYTRVSHFLDPEVEATELMTTASELGNKVDRVVRDFFSGRTPVNDFAPDYDFMQFVEELGKIKKVMDERGEIVIAEDIVVYDDALGIAGTIDLLTYDKDNNVRIYDIKSMRGNNFAESYNEDVSKYDTTKYGKSKRQKHTEQLSMYRMLLNNTNGILANTIAILPVALKYNKGDTSTEMLQLLKGVRLLPMDNIKEASLKETKPGCGDFIN